MGTALLIRKPQQPPADKPIFIKIELFFLKVV